MRFRGSRAAVALLLLAGSTSLLAHPWGGLVVDDEGAIYFTFTCPMEGDGHVACVYRIEPGESTPQPVLVASADPSDIVLARNPSRQIYAAERVGSQPFHTRLWRLSADDEPQAIIPFSPPEQFSADPYSVTDRGQVLFAVNGKIIVYGNPEKTDQLASSLDDGDVPIDDRSIRLMLATNEDDLLVVNRDALLRLSTNQSAGTVADGLRESSPEQLPFRGANILFDIAVVDDVTLLAYYGNREVLRVTGDGERTSLLTAEPPWSPHGVDVFEGKVYVLESTTPVPAWKFWESTRLVPRIRVIDGDGETRTIFTFGDDVSASE